MTIIIYDNNFGQIISVYPPPPRPHPSRWSLMEEESCHMWLLTIHVRCPGHIRQKVHHDSQGRDVSQSGIKKLQFGPDLAMWWLGAPHFRVWNKNSIRLYAVNNEGKTNAFHFQSGMRQVLETMQWCIKCGDTERVTHTHTHTHTHTCGVLKLTPSSPTSIPLSPLLSSLINLMVSGVLKHHVYLLRAIALRPTFHWLFRSHDLPSKFKCHGPPR